MERDGRTRVIFNATSFGQSYFYQTIYFDVMYYVFSFGLPLALLLILNTRLIISYRAMQRKRLIMFRHKRHCSDYQSTTSGVTEGNARTTRLTEDQSTPQVQHENEQLLPQNAQFSSEVYDKGNGRQFTITDGDGNKKPINNAHANTTTPTTSPMKPITSPTPRKSAATHVAMSNEGGSRVTEEISITLVMIAVIIVFILCAAPARLVQLTWSYVPVSSCPSVALVVTEVASMLEVLNSSANFLVYISVRPAFRAIIASIFCGGCRCR